MPHVPSMVPSSRLRRQRRNLLLATLAIALVVVAGMWFGAAHLFLDGFAQVEEDLFRRDLARARQAVGADIGILGSIARDWATWDDASNFIAGTHPGFVDSNLATETFENLGVEVIAYCDLSGRVVGGRTREGTGRAAIDLPAHDEKVVRALCAEAAEAAGPLSGLRAADVHRFAFAALPVVRTSGEGPVRGTLVMTRDLSSVISAARRITGLDLSLIGPGTAELPPPVHALLEGRTPQPEVLEPRDDDTLVAWTTLPGARGDPPFLLRVIESRPILRQGRSTVAVFRGGVLAFTALGLLVFLALLDRLVLTRESHREAERLYQAVVERTAEGILLVSGERHRIVEANRAAERLLGRGARELKGTPLLTLLEIHPEKYAAAIGMLRASESASLGDVRLKRRDGAVLNVEATASVISPDAPDHLCVVLHDLTERVRAEDAVRHHAFHDPLTGLPNRLLFADRMLMAVSQARRASAALGIAYLDLDDFKVVNDTLGHDAGDLLLHQAADRLRMAVREGDTVARQGGDEFLILLTSIDGPEAALAVAQRVVEHFREPFAIQGHEFSATASIGIAMFPGDGNVPDDLVRNADVAMYHAKERGRSRVEMYDPGMRERVSAAVHLRSRLQIALDREEFVLHYQPQVDLGDGRIRGVEALLRWHDPEHGLVQPSGFLRAAEDGGLIVPLGEWVLRRACADIRAWGGAGFPTLRVAINLSPQQVRRRGMDAQVERALKESGVEPSSIELEIGEPSVLHGPESIREFMEGMRHVGVSLAMDGFGTGNASLGHLRSLPMDTLKIDRGLLEDLTRQGDDHPLVRGIVGLAHTLGLRVVALGVETRHQLGVVRGGGCDRAQGFGLCRPVPWDDVTTLLRHEADLVHDLEEATGTETALA